MIDINDYVGYLRKIGFAETGINTYKNHISDLNNNHYLSVKATMNRYVLERI